MPVYPAQQIERCTAARYGEIVSVVAAPKPAVVKGDGDDRFLDDPNMDSCAAAAVQYVGLTTQLMQGFWRPFLQITSALSKPSPRQEAAGQHWAACIVAPQPSDSVTNTRSAQQYDVSIRDALHTGAQRDQLGSCTTTTDSSNGFTTGGCQQPHALELMAFGDSGDHPVSRVQIQVSCQQLARQFTAMADPAAAGALSIRIDVTDSKTGAIITTPQVPAHSNLACTIASTSTRKLRGSLIALGQNPIPWA